MILTISAIEQELSPGERLIWSGQPRRGIRFRPADALLIPFSLLWCGFAIFWVVMATWATAKDRSPIGFLFPLFGLPFVFMGLYLVFGRFIIDARQRESTFYGVTNERVIIVSGLFSRRVHSLSLRTLGDLALSERPDGSGTITFGHVHPFAYMMATTSWPGVRRTTAAPGFDMIDRVREVYDMIRTAQKQLPPAAQPQ